MFKIEKIETFGWEAAVRGMRNPMNSWDKSDSVIGMCDGDCFNCRFEDECGRHLFTNYQLYIGPNDYKLMKNLAKAGSDHGKYRRMIMVAMDITAPLYWWKEFDTYKVGTVANSCSTMHKIHSKEFTLDDFSHEHLDDIDPSYEVLELTIKQLNVMRKLFNEEPANKTYWYNMIQLLPSSYNQKRTVTLNYEVLANMYRARKNHKLDEWREFCTILDNLPYSGLITLNLEDKSDES